MAPQEFLDTLLPAAQACQRKTGIPASFTLAQAALESAWGASKLAKQGCNLFGVKADKSWTGSVLEMPTYEYVKGQRITVIAKWRSYPDWLACMLDRAEFFRKNPRYTACFKQTAGEGWARAVAAAGYATDPEYANKLCSVIRGRNLARFDHLEAA
jgi:flagellum-specific peptidoglycan hydrolase FlgJ